MIGKYQIVELAGQGSFGKVHKAWKEDEGKMFAVKEVTKANMSEGVFNNLLREVQISKQLNHPNLCHCILTMESKSSFYMVFDYCEGGDLDKYLKAHKRISVRKAMKIIRQIRDGYSYMLQNNIMHRDLKLENILFVDKQHKKVKISDFGSSKISMFGSTVIGTPKYMALEVLNENEKYNYKADIWSFALCCWELLYGYGNFPFSLASRKDLMNDIRQFSGEDLRFPPEPKYPPEVRDFFVRCLQISPEKRIEAKEFFSHPFFELNVDKLDQVSEDPKSPSSDPLSGLGLRPETKYPTVAKFLRDKLTEARACKTAGKELYRFWDLTADKQLGCCALGLSLMLLERAKKRGENMVLCLERKENFYELDDFAAFAADESEVGNFMSTTRELLSRIKSVETAVFTSFTELCPASDVKEQVNESLYRKPTKENKTKLLRVLVDLIHQNSGKGFDSATVGDFLNATKKALMLMGGKAAK